MLGPTLPLLFRYMLVLGYDCSQTCEDATPLGYVYVRKHLT